MSKISLLALSGLAASAATGQSVTIHFDIDSDPASGSEVVASVGDTLTWSVYASFTGFDDQTAYFGGFVGDFMIDNPGAASVSNVQSLMANVAIEPTTDAGSVMGVNMFNNALLGSDDQANPYLMMTFETVVNGEFSYTASGVSSVFPSDFIFDLPLEFTDARIVSDSVVIPTPGAVALLGLGGLVGVRRRR